ncbi:hypothetical protein OC844_005210 [Tilletia horrida]|nr:hypothetical protein OC844_005210 [Tilletia horrida]
MLASRLTALPILLAAAVSAGPSPTNTALDATLQLRAGPPVAPDTSILSDIMLTHFSDWSRYTAEARRAGFPNTDSLPPAEVQRIQGLLASANRAQDGMQRVQQEMERMVELENRRQRLAAAQRQAAQRGAGRI